MSSSSGSSSRSRASTLALSLLPLLVALQLHGGSSFLLPVTSRRHHASREQQQQKSPSEGGQEEKEDDGRARSPAGLTLEGVYKRLKLEAQGHADGVVGLESKDTSYGVSVEVTAAYITATAVICNATQRVSRPSTDSVSDGQM